MEKQKTEELLSKLREKLSDWHSYNNCTPHGNRDMPAWKYAQDDFKAGWDAALEVGKIVAQIDWLELELQTGDRAMYSARWEHKQKLLAELQAILEKNS